MKTSLARAASVLLCFVATTPILRAHPGHDDHEFTWDFSHLAAYPLATAGWAAIVIALGVLSWMLLRRSATVIQSLRGSQPSRGK